jgi:hypothetical protein
MRGSDEREYGNRIRGHHGGELLSDRPKSCLAKWIEFWCSLPESRTGGPDCIPRDCAGGKRRLRSLSIL